MGQSTSAQSSQSTVTNEELSTLFARACARLFQPIELLSIRRNMETFDKDRNQLITQFELVTMLGLPGDLPHLSHLLFGALKVLCRYPLLTADTQGITFQGLIRAMALLNRERGSKILPNFEIVKLVFISLAIDSAERASDLSESQTILFSAPGIVKWSDLPVVLEDDGLNVNKLHVPASDLLEVVAFLLVISRLEPTETLKAYEVGFSRFEQYKKQALSIIRSMNKEITKDTLDHHVINYKQFSNAMEAVAPNLLHPLKSLLEQLLFDTKQETLTPIHTTSRLVNEFSLAQLSSFMRRELVYSNIRKLYVGADSGFSMRSFEAKAFKWNAPTIMIMKGTRVSKTHTNSRYTKFEEHFPKYKGPTPEHAHDDDQITFGVYLDQPWKISNKETFGGNKTFIFQLAPVQRIFHAGVAAKRFAYFNTLGGGIGFGSDQPTMKNKFLRYNPGNVSLTLDSTLEFGVFRHLGLGGDFKSTNPDDWVEEWEDRFLISDAEVWGCGGEKEIEEQNKRWEWEQQEAKRRQGIDLKSMGEDRALLEMAGLVGQYQGGGSV